MSYQVPFYAVLALLLCREFYFMRQINKLVDKIMCKSLYEYKLAQTVGKPREVVAKIDDELEEDLGSLQGIG